MKTANEVRQAIANQQDTNVEFNYILGVYEQELTDKIEKIIMNKTNCFVHNVAACYVGEVMKMLTDKGFSVRISNSLFVSDERYHYHEVMVTLVITL
jgi:hypothetical protein